MERVGLTCDRDWLGGDNKLNITMSESTRINPELSVMNEKNEVKKQREQKLAMENRV